MSATRYLLAHPSTLVYGDLVRVPSPNGWDNAGWRETLIGPPYQREPGLWAAHPLDAGKETAEVVWLPDPTQVKINLTGNNPS